MPQSGAITVDDPDLAAYNAYLTAIAQPAHRETDETASVPSVRAGAPRGSAEGSA